MKTKLCPLHNVEMKQRTSRDGAKFYSHARKTNDVWEYCNGRLGFPSEAMANR